MNLVSGNSVFMRHLGLGYISNFLKKKDSIQFACAHDFIGYGHYNLKDI